MDLEGAPAAPLSSEYLPVLGHQRQFGRYQLLYRFATGGMAEVFLGRLLGEDGFERHVALKIIHEHLTRQPEFVKMFIDEARLASRISHPNVAMTLELGRVDRTHFIAMEYVDGESLAALVRRVRPPLRHVARIIADAAGGLHAAHELRGKDGQLLNVVHRDVSPQNLLISYDGAVKVVDFGVARARGSLHTTAGEVKGKFGYMSPEQLTDPGKVDRRTDVFALGIILYEVTTWKRLFKAATEADTIARVLNTEIAPPSSIVQNYSPQLEQIVMRALARDPADRIPSAHALQTELERYIAATGEPVLQPDIGKMMGTAFGDRIREKRTLLHNAERDIEGSVPDASVTSGSTNSLVLATVPSLISAKRQKQQRRLVILLVGGLGLAGLVVGGLFATGVFRTSDPPRSVVSQPLNPDRADATPAPVREIKISLRVSPSSASISLDGKAMPNPLTLTRRASDGTAELVASAPGHQPQRFQVTLSQDWSRTVALEPEPASKPDKKGKKAVKKGGKQGKKQGEEDLLTNPYEKKSKKKGKKGDEDLLTDPYK